MASRYFTPRVWTRECNQLISLAGDALLDARPKQVALS